MAEVRWVLVEVCWQVVVMTSSQCSVMVVSTISSYSWGENCFRYIISIISRCRYLDISTLQYLFTWWHSFLGVSTWRGVQVFTGTEWHTGADTATGAAAYP